MIKVNKSIDQVTAPMSDTKNAWYIANSINQMKLLIHTNEEMISDSDDDIEVPKSYNEPEFDLFQGNYRRSNKPLKPPDQCSTVNAFEARLAQMREMDKQRRV